VKLRGTAAFASGVAVAMWCGWVAFPGVLYRSTPQPFHFSHKTHAGEKAGMMCEDCHAVSDDGRFAGIPRLETCSSCHAEAIGGSADEKLFVEQYVKASREVGWLVYSRQPDNVSFSHATHVKVAKLECEKCHGQHGKTEKLRAYQENRVSGYSRDLWGPAIARISYPPVDRPGMKMDDCAHCHRQKDVLTSCLDCHK
jgi:hypothetical protein